MMGKGVRGLLRADADAPPLLVAANACAEGLLGLVSALDALASLDGSRSSVASWHKGRLRAFDWLPAVIVAARVVLAIGAVELLWIASAWPDGGNAVAYVAVSAILFSPRGLQGYASARTFLIGCTLGIVLGGTTRFFVLPICADFGEFCLALALVLVPLGALSQRPSNGLLFTFAAVNFGVGLNAGNVTSYDVAVFYNQSVAIFVGSFAAAGAIALLPALSTEVLIDRASAATERDVRAIAAGRLHLDLADWGNRIHFRLSYLQAHANSNSLSRLSSALADGAGVIRLRVLAQRLRLCGHDLTPAFKAIADGDRAAAFRILGDIDEWLATVRTGNSPRKRAVIRARGAIQMLIGSSERLGIGPASEAGL
jgi:uncharacterized membrane protein YccC